MDLPTNWYHLFFYHICQEQFKF